MPVERGPRHHKPGESRPLLPWDCPACGTKNEGRKPELGCGHCGAGDPTKSRAGGGEAVGRQQSQNRQSEALSGEAVAVGKGDDATLPSMIMRESPAASGVSASSTRIYRIIEYLIRPGKDVDQTLRNSLVGRIDYDWGTLTATIVDTLDPRQEDRLRMARMQPGVWLANGEAMRGPRHPIYYAGYNKDAPESDKPTHGLMGWDHPVTSPVTPRINPMEMPDTGPAFSPEVAQQAKQLVMLLGLKTAHTIALALSSIAEELGANSEPEKFLTSQECLQMANALMQWIPAEWQGDHEEVPSGPSR